MEKRNATVAVIGAGDYIGGEIAKKFAAEDSRCSQGGAMAPSWSRWCGISRLPADRSWRARSMRGKRTRSRPSSMTPTSTRRWKSASSMSRQCQLSDPGDHRPGVPKSLGNGMLGRLSCGPRIGAADGAARQGQHLLHRRHREPARRQRICRLRQRQIRAPRVAQSMARELGPKNIHVAHLIIDSGVDTAWVRERREQLWGKEALNNPDLLMPPASVAASYWQLYQQPRSAWTFELEIRPFAEKW